MSIGKLVVVVVVLALIIAGVGYQMGWIKVGDNGVSVTAPQVTPDANAKPADPYDAAEVDFMANKWPEAIAGYRKALDAKPDSDKAADAMYRIGKCWDTMGNGDEAIKAFQAFADKFPSNLHTRDAQQRIEYYKSQNGK